MGLLYWFKGIRIPLLTDFMLLITHFGEETAFLVTAIIIFWCANKKQGYYILSVGFLGTLANQFLKMWYRIPRPWVLDPDFTAVEAAKAEATGFSFPSGHTQSSVGTFGAIAFSAKQKWTRLAAMTLVILVPLSRMYLGVHTPQDVIVSVFIAVVLIFVVYPFVFGGSGSKRMIVLIGCMLALAVSYLCFVTLYPFPGDVDQERLASGISSGYTMLGSLLGLVVVYIVDEKWLKFPVKAKWWAQIVKVVIGLGLVLAVKSGLKEPLNLLMGEHVGRAVRYFLIVITAGILWPSSFRFFANLGSGDR